MGASRPDEDTPPRSNLAVEGAAEPTASTARGRRVSAPPRVTRLVVVHPRPRGPAPTLTLGEEDATIGRQAGPTVALAIAHATVSRAHATVRWDARAGRHTVVDRGSRNGTWLEGQPVATLPKFLADNSVLRLGDVLAVYERGEAPPPAAPAAVLAALPGDSLAAQRMRAAVARAGPDLSAALILGETGAGKERVAAELHRLSGRRGPFIAVNCAAFSAPLFESQLFGHVRGAFTGASQDHPGLFRAAHGGTLFLDELGELPIELQPKLLRAVELGEVSAVGSTQTQRVDVRLVAATNRALTEDIARGKFRRDLYARLALWEVEVPPLRSRRADILGWIDRLHRAWAEQRGRPVAPLDLSVEAAQALLLARWPDNLRGLQRVVHACAAAPAGPIERDALPAWLDEPAPPPAPRPEEPARRGPRPRPARDELVAALEAHGWSLRATAKHYDRDRKQIVRWVEMYAIDVPWRAED